MSLLLKKLRQRLVNTVAHVWGVAANAWRAGVGYWRRAGLYQRHAVIRTVRDRAPARGPRPRVLAVIAHVTSAAEAADRAAGSAKVERLQATLDGLLTSFAHGELRIVVKTVPGRHVTAWLPDYQRACIEVQEEHTGDPMFLGFRCQDELVRCVDQHDWFLFLEDDIVLHDSFFTEKLTRFQSRSGMPWAVLLPNRFEMWRGTKRYIDLTVDRKIQWNALTAVEVDGVQFAECSNPHSGLFCLSKDQLRTWIASGRRWRDQDFGFGGPRECAATYSLLECFIIYKPHPANLNYLEVQHHDTKYSQLHTDFAPGYEFSAVRRTDGGA